MDLCLAMTQHATSVSFMNEYVNDCPQVCDMLVQE